MKIYFIYSFDHSFWFINVNIVLLNQIYQLKIFIKYISVHIFKGFGGKVSFFQNKIWIRTDDNLRKKL